MTDAPARDPGLQPERTRLAWTRTALAVAVNSVLIVRSGLIADAPAFIAVGVLLTLAALGAILFGVWRARELARTPLVAPVHPLVVLVAVSLSVLACLAGVASIVIAG